MYYPIKLKNLSRKCVNNENIDNELIKKLMLQNILECPYSTFPYMSGKNSKQSQRIYGCGNCVAMSINLQKMLKKHNIKSYLIPATIPEMYYIPEFLDISHVAVAILLSDKMAMIIDPAFYFLEPMIIETNGNYENKIKWKSVYKGIEEDLMYNLKQLPEDIKYNEYQTVPANTYYVETFRPHEPEDKWYYYLTEIKNPDNAITSFNLTGKKYPFMAVLGDDYNLKLLLKYHDKENLKIKYNNENIYEGKLDDIPEPTMELIKPYLIKYFGNAYKKHLRCPEEADTKIYKLTDSDKPKRTIKKNKNPLKNKKSKKSKKVSFKQTPTIIY